MEYVDNYCKDNPLYETRTEYGERRDCTVMAMAKAFDIPYEVAHKHIKDKLGRKKGQGVNMFLFPDSLPEGTIKTIPYKNAGNNITLGKFCKAHPEGRFIVLVRGHALAVIDGVVYDHSEKPRRHVMIAFQVLEEFCGES